MRLPDAALLLAALVLVAATVREIVAADAARRADRADAAVFLRYVSRSGAAFGGVYVKRVLDMPGRRVYRVCADHLAGPRRKADYRVCALLDRTARSARIVAVRRFSPTAPLPPFTGDLPS